MSSPLSGLRILDLTRLLPGPYATRQLAELGAEVIKVEAPQGGDYARWYPPLCGEPPASGIFRELNRGKKSIELDLRTPEGMEVLHHLAGTVDVLVDSFRPGVLERLGFDPQAVMQENPRLIYCAMTGFGLTGPHAQRPGHDINYQARAGGLGVSSDPDAPVLGPLQVADLGGALVAVSGILAALFKRERSGKGSVVDTSLCESSLAFASIYFGKDLAGEAPERGQEMLDGSRPSYTIYETQEGRHLSVGAIEPKFWKAFITALDLPELESCSMDGGAGGAATKAKIQAVLSSQSAAHWVQTFEPLNACVELIQTIPEARTDPQHLHRQAFLPDGTVRSPIRVGDWDELEAPRPSLSESPGLGEDTRAVLEDAGVSAELIARCLD
jgi:alpha-methylacyl-CoA racemase